MIEFHGVSYRYPSSSVPAIADVDLQIERGEYVVVAGRSGSGKSTLLRCMNGLIPHFHGGAFSGEVLVNGIDTKSTDVRELSGIVGLVFQDPENQFVTTSVRSEIAFGQQNIGIDPMEAHERLSELGQKFDLTDLLDRVPGEISGGEKQKAIVASVAAMGTQALVLDEPTSQLDPTSASQILGLLRELNEEGMTVVLTEHRLKRALEEASRCLVLDSGHIALDGTPRDLKRLCPDLVSLRTRNHQRFVRSEGTRIEVRNLFYQYSTGDGCVLQDLSLDVMRGEILGIVARNGGGKTTLARILAGLLTPYEGQVSVDGQELSSMSRLQVARNIGIVFQDPNIHLFHDTVREEIGFARRNLGLGDGGEIDLLLGQLGLEGFEARNPRDLSGGQKEKVAIGSVLSYGPDVLILDEPTRGLDVIEKKGIMLMLRQLIREMGITVLVLTHDLDMVESFADRAAVISGGRISFQGSPSEAVRRFSEEV